MSSISGLSSGYATTSSTSASTSRSAASASGEQALSKDQEAQVRDLKKADAEVRAHERAHKTAAGPYAGSIQLEYTSGPDGRRYATSGEVDIDISPVRGDPEATIDKMEVVKRAALAPQSPSPQDRAVAAQADAIKAQAQIERSNNGDDPSENGGAQQEAASAREPADLAALRQAQKSYGRAAEVATRPSLSILA